MITSSSSSSVRPGRRGGWRSAIVVGALSLLGSVALASPAAATDFDTVDIDPHFQLVNPDYGTATAIVTSDEVLRGGDRVTFASTAGYFDLGPELDLTLPTTIGAPRLFAWPERWDDSVSGYTTQCDDAVARAELGLADYQDCVDSGVVTDLALVRNGDGSVTLTIPSGWSPPRVASGFVIRQFYVGFTVEPDVSDPVCSPSCMPSRMINVAVTFTVPAYSLPGNGSTLDLAPATRAESITVDMASPTPVRLPTTGGVASFGSPLTLTTPAAAVSLPADIRLTSSDIAWDGTVSPPTALPTASVTALEQRGVSGAVTAVVEVGSTTADLELDQAARVVLTGQGGKTAAYQRVGGSGLTPIEATCSEDAAAGLASAQECSVTVGDDLVIWTKHFTVFAAIDYPALAVTGSGDMAPWAGAAAALLAVGAVLVARARRSGS